MRVANTVRRTGLAAVGLLSALVLVTGCSSSSNGTPETPTSAGGGVSSEPGASGTVGIGSLTASAPITSSDDGGGGASAEKFCSDFSNVDPSDFTATGDLSGALKIYDKLVDDAPAGIKDDITLIRDYIKAAASGNPDPNAAQKLQGAFTNLASFAASNCAGS